ncbi:hypothetical protein BOX15_Mlig005543g1 [Macrostomum lignano]|uniref:LEM domain-containing protein n=1 Tax=Macrostomum lignano TaxID=282301 RepID=A0A267H0J4_9PLAT|nr:hypothetical protein BOX15_Mlig005543g1 [Macrostomum lignano]
MDEINQLNDAELRDELAVHMGDANVPPVTDTTRHLMRRKLYRLRSGQQFVSVCSNDQAEDSESDVSDGDGARRQPVSPGTRDASIFSAAGAAAAAASSPAGRRFDSPPQRPGASPADDGSFGSGGGSVFRETYRRRPLHENDAGTGYYGNVGSPSGARPAPGAAAAPSRFRPSLLNCILALALIGAVAFLLLHFDPLYENPVPEISH